MEQRTLTTGEVGRYCGVHFRTVLRWIEQGRLKAFRLPGRRGDNRVRVEDFIAFLRENRMPVPEALGPAGPRRVLVVEDEAGMANAMRRVLERAGFEVETAADGFQAGVFLESFRPAVMTLDLRMPGLSGFDVLDFLRSRPELGGVRVLVVSALPRTDLDRALSAGADDVLEKPFEDAALVERVACLTEGRAREARS